MSVYDRAAEPAAGEEPAASLRVLPDRRNRVNDPVLEFKAKFRPGGACKYTNCDGHWTSWYARVWGHRCASNSGRFLFTDGEFEYPAEAPNDQFDSNQQLQRAIAAAQHRKDQQ